MDQNEREIPLNCTSADDRLIVTHLLGVEVWEQLEQPRELRITGAVGRSDS